MPDVIPSRRRSSCGEPSSSWSTKCVDHRQPAEVAELADTASSKSVAREGVWVRAPPSASRRTGRWRPGTWLCRPGAYTSATQRDYPAPSRARWSNRRRMSLKLKRKGCSSPVCSSSPSRSSRRARWDDGGEAPEVRCPSSSCTAVEYEGDGDPDVLIASDLPLQGPRARETLQIDDAIRQVLTTASRRPATTPSASRPATTLPRRPATGTPASARRTRNNYAANDKVIGVIGHVQLAVAPRSIIPVLNKAHGGRDGIAMLFPSRRRTRSRASR